ncbi:Hypothetical predicted protein, partial [Mytilus galloprovincialis]
MGYTSCKEEITSCRSFTSCYEVHIMVMKFTSCKKKNSHHVMRIHIIWGPHFRFYHHKDDVGVKCRTEPEPDPERKVRLIGPLSTEGEGRLEYFKHGHWRTVCKAYMGTSEASAFCFLLGYRNGGYILQNRDSLNASRFYGPPWNEYLDCPWNTTDIETCLTRNWAYKDFRKTCDAHTNDAALKCRTDEYP